MSMSKKQICNQLDPYYIGSDHFIYHDHNGDPLTIPDARNTLCKKLSTLPTVDEELIRAINEYCRICEEAASVSGYHDGRMAEKALAAQPEAETGV